MASLKKGKTGAKSKATATKLAAQATKDVTFEWKPSGSASWMKVDAKKLTHSPTTLPLTRGLHKMQWLLTGAQKTPYMVKVSGAQYPTEPITGVIPDEGFDAGTSDVEV